MFCDRTETVLDATHPQSKSSGTLFRCARLRVQNYHQKRILYLPPMIYQQELH